MPERINIVAIDPGTNLSALVEVEMPGLEIRRALLIANDEFLSHLAAIAATGNGDCVIEKVASYGMPVGEEVFATCRWTGRFQQVWFYGSRREAILMPRLDVKMNLCHSARAKDGNVRQALIDRFGEPGTKKNPGRLYGIKSHLWPALALAVTFYDKQLSSPAALPGGDE